MGSELATRGGSLDLPSEQSARAITTALAELRAIRTFIAEQFKKGIDYGLIPHCGDKPTLLLPGAQKTVMYCNCYPTYAVKNRDLGNGHVEYVVRTRLISRANGQQVGEGLGSASTKETRFRRGGTAKTCPSCGVAAIAKSKEEKGGGWYCNGHKGGCWATFPKNHKALSAATPVNKADDESAYEMHNTVLKMAKKRSLVDASITLACLSELFTQDIEDTFDINEVQEAARSETTRPAKPVKTRVVEPPPSDLPTSRSAVNDTFSSPSTTKADRSKEKIKLPGDKIGPKGLDVRTWVKLEEEETARANALVNEYRASQQLEPAEAVNLFEVTRHMVKWSVKMGAENPEPAGEDGKPKRVGIGKLNAHLNTHYLVPSWRDPIREELLGYLGEKIDAATQEPALVTAGSPNDEPDDDQWQPGRQ